MKKSKKDRLRAAGWRVGNTREFLDLSDEEAALIDLKLGFADFLRNERQKRKLSQTELAKRCGSSQSRIAKMETGEASVSIDLMFRVAFRLGLTPSALGRAMIRADRSTRSNRRAS